YQQLYEMDEAMLYGEKALAEYALLRMGADEFNAIVNKGTIELAKGNIGSAQRWAEKALAQWNSISPGVPPSQKLVRLSAESLKYTCSIVLADSLADEQGIAAALHKYSEALYGLREVLNEVAKFDTLNQDVKVATASLVGNIQSCFSSLRSIEPAWADSILYYYKFLSDKGVRSDKAVLYFGITQAYAALAFAEKKQWQKAYDLSKASCDHYGYERSDIFDKAALHPEQIHQKQPLIFVLRLQAKILQKRKGDQIAQKQALFVYDQIFRLLDELRLGFLSESSMELSTERFIRLYHEATMATIELYKQTGQPEYFEKAFQYAEQGKSFTLRNVLRRRVEDNVQSAKERELRTRLREAESAYQKNPSSAQLAVLGSAYKNVQTWQEGVRETHPRYYSEQISKDSMNLEAVRKMLVTDDSTALIEFSTGNDSTLLLAVTKSETYWEVIHHPVNWSKTLDDYCGAIFYPSEKFKANGAKIYEVLLKKMLERQLPPTIKRLILVPDGRLRELVFESLLTRSAKPNEAFATMPYLLRRYDCTYHYSLMAYKYAAVIKREAPNRSLGVYIAKYAQSDTVSPQRCSNAELKELEAAARNIADSWGKNKPVQTFEPATETDFDQKAGDFDELLFVMHGCIDPVDLLESSILFTRPENESEGDGRLTIGEVLGRDKNLNARLAVFVSCNAARGRRIGGEGIISLARAFAYTGVPAMVATTAFVRDNEASSKLLKRFHQNLGEGMSKDKALAEAKKELMNSYHPSYWANFILIGDPAPMSDK
ncbi:MAG TPA: CHAT domain-containing protein, partial [Saprospiraceae bacterium]|nr:CHAT domain-containing protein [Saprospiraceae bacterium]